MAYVRAPKEFYIGPTDPWDDGTLRLRTEVYIQQPKDFEISGCPKCGLADTEWSEYKSHCWCPVCKFDFRPKNSGIFGGPVPVHICELLGIYFDTLDLATNEIKPGPSGVVHYHFPTEKEKSCVNS